MTELAHEPSPEALLRQEVLDRTLAPLIAAQQATHTKASQVEVQPIISNLVRFTVAKRLIWDHTEN